MACLVAVQEAIWLRRFFQHLRIVICASDSMTIHCDSMVALVYAKDLKFHGHTKHIDIHYNFIRNIVAQKKVTLEYIPASYMIVDPSTKPITRGAYLDHGRAEVFVDGYKYTSCYCFMH